jgi:hypothetical protein
MLENYVKVKEVSPNFEMQEKRNMETAIVNYYQNAIEGLVPENTSALYHAFWQTVDYAKEHFRSLVWRQVYRKRRLKTTDPAFVVRGILVKYGVYRSYAKTRKAKPVFSLSDFVCDYFPPDNYVRIACRSIRTIREKIQFLQAWFNENEPELAREFSEIQEACIIRN